MGFKVEILVARPQKHREHPHPAATSVVRIPQTLSHDSFHNRFHLSQKKYRIEPIEETDGRMRYSSFCYTRYVTKHNFLCSLAELDNMSWSKHLTTRYRVA